MRIWLRIPAEPLRRALAELLVDAGHDVSAAVAPTVPPDLRIDQGEALEHDAGPGGRTVLHLGPRHAQGARDPGAALAHALVHGGRVTWPSPIEPRRLLEALATRGGRAAEDPREHAPSEGSLGAAPDPWLLLDPVLRRISWANPEARVRLGLTAEDPSLALGQPPLAAVAEEVFARLEGRSRTDHAGVAGLAVWWTDEHGRRVLGLFGLPVPALEDPRGNTRAIAEIGRLSATLAHEIRNPLAALVGALDLLEGDVEPIERAEIVSLARQRLQQMKTLLDDTLRLVRPFREPPAPLDVVAVVHAAVVGMRTDPSFRRVTMREELGDELVSAFGHEQPLRQAVTNLLVNAAQAQEGDVRVTVRLATEGTWAVLRVEDDGPGIPADKREKVFEAFWTTKAAGTGLGLSFVRRVAEASGGRVSVEDVRTGACLRLDLPLAP